MSRYRDRHPGPDDVIGIMEISDESLSADRIRKSAIYAGAGIRQYWIVNLNDARVEVYTNPIASGGARYQDARTYTKSESAPLMLDDAVIEIPFEEILS